MYEGKCQTAARKKRKTLYPHIILLTEGRLFFLMLAIFPFWILYVVLRQYQGWQYCIILLVVIVPCSIYINRIFWPLCFGELTLTKDYVKWHGLFLRSVKIPYSELRYVEIRRFDEGNVAPDFYGTGQMYLLLSTKPLPKKRIDKIRCGDGLIKYQFLMRDAQTLSEFIPEPFDLTGCFARGRKYMLEKRKQWRATGRNGKPSAKRCAKSAGKSGRQKSKKSMDRSGRC